jgi:hypothetical protein
VKTEVRTATGTGRKYTTVHCSREGCSRELTFRNAQNIREGLRLEGWTVCRGEAYCPADECRRFGLEDCIAETRRMIGEKD